MPQGRGEDTDNRCPTPYPVSSSSTTWTKGIKDRKTSSVDLNKYTTMKNICGDRVKGVYGQRRPKKSPDECPHPSPKHNYKQKCQGGSITALLRHQIDQHVLDIQRNVHFLQIVHPDRGVPRHETARRLPRIPGCGESLPTDFTKPTPRGSPGPACPPGSSRR